jgi:quercetin dioxygenase-like cupin family protein
MIPKKSALTAMVAVLLAVAISLNFQSNSSVAQTAGQQSTAQGTEQPTMSKAPDEMTMTGIRRSIEFQNDQVTVVRYRFEARAKIPMHDAPNAVVVWLTDGHLRLTFPDGTLEDLNFKVGQTAWDAAGRHSGENLADVPLEFISIQLPASNNGTVAMPSVTEEATIQTSEEPR